jgi:hypothetical protein
MGQAGDVSAACMAAALYWHHTKEMVAGWNLGFEAVLKSAMRFKDSGHPVCVGVEASAYLYGWPGYPKDEKRSTELRIRAAAAGSAGEQKYMAAKHIAGAQRLEPKSVALEICWTRVAATKLINERTSFDNTCRLYRRGVAMVDGEPKKPPQDIQEIALHWCSPFLTVTPDMCAYLESETSSQPKELAK